MAIELYFRGGDDTVVIAHLGTTAGEFRVFYDTLSLADLRRRQDLTDQQIRMAYDQRKTRALMELQAVRDLLSEAVGRNYAPS